MTAMAGPRKTISIHDYPEHLNPFREDDNHSKIRFWTIGRKLSRSNSITFSGLKDLRNTWSLRSFMRKGKKSEQASGNKHPSGNKNVNQGNGENSPIMFRRAMQYASMSVARNTVGSPERAERYIYGGSVTPLPRSRFQERLRSSQHEVSSLSATPRMARSDITGSRLSVASTNPFDEPPAPPGPLGLPGPPVPPARASRRKKKKAPAPPSASLGDESVTSDNLSVTEVGDVSKTNASIDEEMEDMNLKVELKIVEDEDHVSKEINQDFTEVLATEVETAQTISTENDQAKEKTEISEDDNHEETVELRHKPEVVDIDTVPFPKVDITKYRRNSSVNEDDIRLRRGNLEDFHPLSNKRSKSLTNNLSGETYITYDINLNENENTFDINSNEEPQKVVCKIYEESRKKSIDNSISSTEKEFLEIDKATRELEREISKLNSALIEDDFTPDNSRLSVSEIRQKFDKKEVNSPNPIPKPRRSNHAELSLTNGKL